MMRSHSTPMTPFNTHTHTHTQKITCRKVFFVKLPCKKFLEPPACLRRGGGGPESESESESESPHGFQKVPAPERVEEASQRPPLMYSRKGDAMWSLYKPLTLGPPFCEISKRRRRRHGGLGLDEFSTFSLRCVQLRRARSQRTQTRASARTGCAHHVAAHQTQAVQLFRISFAFIEIWSASWAASFWIFAATSSASSIRCRVSIKSFSSLSMSFM